MLPLIHALMEKPGKEKIYNISMLSLSSLIIIISINLGVTLSLDICNLKILI